jgi:hypothetical protein
MKWCIVDGGQWLKTESSLHEQRRARPTRLFNLSPHLRDDVVFPLALVHHPLIACLEWVTDRIAVGVCTGSVCLVRRGQSDTEN